MAVPSLKVDSKCVMGSEGGGSTRKQVCVCTCPRQVRIKQCEMEPDYTGPRSGTDFQTDSRQVLPDPAVQGRALLLRGHKLLLGTQAPCFHQESAPHAADYLKVPWALFYQ